MGIRNRFFSYERGHHMLDRSFGISTVKSARIPNAAVAAVLKEKALTKVAGAKVAGCDTDAIRKAALSATGQANSCGGGSGGQYTTPDYLGPAAAIQSMAAGQDTTFTLTALNNPILITQIQMSVAAKGEISVASLKIAGREYLLNGEILADFFDPQAEESDCPINLPTCALQINQSVVVVLHNYGAAAVLGGVMARGLS